MIVCTRCGFQNEDTDTFCGSCAGFLEWSGQAVSATPEPAPQPEPELQAAPEPEHAGFIDRVKDRIGIGDKDGETGGTAGNAAAGPGAVPADAPTADGQPAPAGAGAATAPLAAPVATASPSPQTGASDGAPQAEAAGPWLASPAPPPPVTAPNQEAAPTQSGHPGLLAAAAAATAAASAAPAAAAPTAAAPAAAPPTAAAPAATPPTAAPPTAAAPAAAPPTAASPAAAPAPPAVAPTAATPVAANPAATAAMAPTAPPGPTPVRPGTAAPLPGAPTRTGTTVSGPNAGGTAPVAPVQPEAVKPTAVRTRPTPRAKIAPTREINPGDLVCSQCGEGNDPGRKFCRRCGASLQQAVIYALPWYSRWWRRLTTRKTRKAGDRPKTRRRAFGGSGPGWLTSWVTRIIALAVIVILILTFVGPWHHSFRHRVNRYYHDVVNVVHPTYNPVHPDSATATSFTRGHPPAFAIDGASNTSWWTGGRGTGQGQKLVILLGNRTNVDKIGFLLGDQDTAAAFLSQGRPSKVLLDFTGGSHPYTKTLTLNDSPTFQSYTLSAKDASQLSITIESVASSPPGTHAAITEVELFKKS